MESGAVWAWEGRKHESDESATTIITIDDGALVVHQSESDGGDRHRVRTSLCRRTWRIRHKHSWAAASAPGC